MRSQQQANNAIEKYADTVRRICMVHLKNEADTEDIFQTVFLKYLLSSVVFENDEHEKAWLIRVTINACKDLLKSFFRSKTVLLEEVLEQPAAPNQEYHDVMKAVLSLPEKYRDAIYLYYYEGYSAAQIGKILHKNQNTVYTLLNRAKKQLRQILGGDMDE